MNALAAAQAEERTIIKPPEWAVYMVTAALKCASDEKLAASHASHDEAKYSILNSLNRLEAHDEYEWPDFSSFNYDFSQVMRLRRALVQDVFDALERAGYVTAIPGTPDSHASSRPARRSDGPGRRLTSRKRLCKREAEFNEDTVSEGSDGGHHDDALLLAATSELVSRSKVDVTGYAQDAPELANMLHDSLVDVWMEPQHDGGEHVESLRQRADVWDRYTRSQPPRSTQRVRTATLRVSPTAPQTEPGTVQKPMFGPTPADASGSCTAADD